MSLNDVRRVKIQLCKDSVSSHRIEATQIFFDTKRPISSAHKKYTPHSTDLNPHSLII